MSTWAIEKLQPTPPRQVAFWVARRQSDGLAEYFDTHAAAERYVIRRQRDEAGQWDVGHRDEAVDKEMAKRHA